MTVAGAVLVLSWLFISGQGPGYLIQIDYTWGGDLLDGAEVVIDGVVVGTLQREGGSPRVTGFRVEPGDHEVLVRSEDCEGTPRTVSLSAEVTRRAVLMADIDDGYRCKVILW